MDKLDDTAKTSMLTSLYLFLGKTFSTVVLAITSILVASLLNPENYGLYSIAIIPALFIADIGDFGVSQAIVRFVANLRFRGKNAEAMDLIKVGLIFKLIVSIPLAIILFLLSDYIAIYVYNRPFVSSFIRLSPLLVVGQSIFFTLNFIFIGLDRAEYSGIIFGIQAAVKAILSVLLIAFGFSTTGAILAAVISTLVSSIIGVLIYQYKKPSFSSEIKCKKNHVPFVSGLKKLCRYGLPLYLTTILVSFLLNYQFFIVAMFASNVEIGNYRVTRNFSAFMMIFLYPITSSSFSAFSKYNVKKNSISLERMFKLSVKYASLIVVPISLFLTLHSREVLSILFGSEYLLASEYLSLYILIYLLIGFGRYLIDKFFNGQGDTGSTLKAILIKSIILVPSTYFFTPKYGVIGLITCVIISEVAMVVYSLYLFFKKYKISINFASSTRIVFVALITTIFVYIFQKIINFNLFITLIVNSAMFLIVYLFLVPLMGAIDKDDLNNLDLMIKDIKPLYVLIKPLLSFENKLMIVKQNLFRRKKI